MSRKLIVFVICAFSAFLQAQSTPIIKNADAEYKPDIRYLQVKLDDKEFNLTLVQRLHEVFLEKTPVWTIGSTEGENVYEILEVPYQKRQINGILYGDDEFMATLFASWDESQREIYYNGLINIGTEIYKVESAADNWWRHSDGSEINYNEEEPLESDEQQQSLESMKALDIKLRSLYAVNSNDAGLLENSLTILYPKILAVVDYTLYNELEQSINKVIEYVTTYWNAIDMKFSKLDPLDIKITVTGILIAKNENVKLISNELKSFNENFIQRTGFVNYDAAFIMSQSILENSEGDINLGSICNRKNSIAFVKDNAKYEGLLSTTHELGHLLNLPHDGLDNAEKCTVQSDSDATYMSANAASTKKLTWSQCSQDIIQEFSKSEAATCLENPWRYH